MSQELIIPKQWSGSDDGERWELIVEHDQMSPGEPLEVTLSVENWEAGEDGKPDRRTFSLACVTPQEAREIASALHVYAFFADKCNRDGEFPFVDPEKRTPPTPPKTKPQET